MSARALMTGDYFSVFADDGARVIRLVRSAQAFPSLETIEATFASVERVLAGSPTSWGLLIDAREGPMRNDPQFEELLARARGRLVEHFSRSAVLIKSAVGRLQIARYGREDGHGGRAPRVFADEAAAIAYLNQAG